MTPEAILQAVRQQCDILNIPKGYYQIGSDKSRKDGEIALDFRGGKWFVFFLERGREKDFAIFDRKMDALTFFFLQISLADGKRELPNIDFSKFSD